jgi:hypothetical protein
MICNATQPVASRSRDDDRRRFWETLLFESGVLISSALMGHLAYRVAIGAATGQHELPSSSKYATAAGRLRHCGAAHRLSLVFTLGVGVYRGWNT